MDLIYFDLSKPLPCKLVVRDLTAAIKRGMYFEIDYNPALRGAGEGRTVFFAASQSKLNFDVRLSASTLFTKPGMTLVENKSYRSC